MSVKRINLTFHGIGEPARPLYEGEKAHWITEDLFRSVILSLGDRDDVALTFDDGNLSDIEIAMPLLKETGRTATFFIVADRIGKPGFLDRQDLLVLWKEGMKIGSHGMQHRAWKNLTALELEIEIDGAKERIEDAIGESVDQAACPFGSYGRRVLQELRRAEFQRVYTSDRGVANGNAWLQPRNSCARSDDASVVDSILDNHRLFPAWIRILKRTVKKFR